MPCPPPPLPRGPGIPSRRSWTVSKPVRHLPSPSSIHNIHIPTEPAAPGVSGRERRLRHFFALCGPRDWPSPDRLCCPRAPLAEISPTRISATVQPVSRPCQRSPCRGGRARTSTDASSRSLSPVSSVGGAQDSDTVFFLGPPRPRAPPPALPRAPFPALAPARSAHDPVPRRAVRSVRGAPGRFQAAPGAEFAATPGVAVPTGRRRCWGTTAKEIKFITPGSRARGAACRRPRRRRSRASRRTRGLAREGCRGDVPELVPPLRSRTHPRTH